MTTMKSNWWDQWTDDEGVRIRTIDELSVRSDSLRRIADSTERIATALENIEDAIKNTGVTVKR